MMKLFRIAVVSLACTTALVAQTSKGILAGVVRDQTGAVVPNAQLTITDQQTKVVRNTTSNGVGAYRVEGIDPDLYTIRVVATGFNTTESTDLRVIPSQVTSFDPSLSIGSDAQTVTVEANSNSVNTENGHLGGTVSLEQIEKLPVFSLNPIALAATVPGVSPVNQTLNLGGLGGNGEQIQVNGARPRANNFLLDGQDINDTGLGGQAFQPQIIDSIQSIAVLTNSTSAEFGRAGGAVVNTITRSGSNSFHGTAWELYQGSGLNSIDGETRQTTGAVKARFNQHFYGFTAGGPIIKDKLFAFGGTQFQRYYGNSQATSVTLPDAAGYQQLVAIPGAQSQLLQQYLGGGAYLANGSTPYSQGPAGPTSRISSRPGCGTGGAGCSITTAAFSRPPVPTSNPDTQWIVRVDFTPNHRDTFNYRYLHDRSSLTPDLTSNNAGLAAFDAGESGPSELAQGGWTHVFTPNLINELRAGETRIGFSFFNLPSATGGPLGTAPNLTFSSSGLPTLGINQNLPQGRSEDLYQIQDTVGWTRGRHSFRIGADLGRQLEKDQVSQTPYGILTFSRAGTTANPALSALDNFLNDRIGSTGTATKNFGPTRIDPHSFKLAGFIQDDIKLTSNLTINLGIRYDYVSPPENSLPFPAIDISNPTLPINTVIRAQSDKNNIAPRFAFAYVPGTSFLRKMAFHGGFGMFYDTDFTNIAVNSAQSAPNAPTGTIVSTTLVPVNAPASTLLATITPQLLPTNSVLSVSNRLVNPYTYQYNFGFERELPGQFKMGINYVGTTAHKLYANQQYNYFNPNTGQRINPTRGAINARINDASSNYNGLQVDLSHQFSRQFSINTNYVFSKMLDNGSEVFATFASPTSYNANLVPGGRRQDWSNSVFDHRHFFSIAYVYSPAGFRSDNALANGFLSILTRHYTISGVTQLQSGSYSTFGINGLDTNGDGSSANDRPVLSNPSASLNAIGIDGYWVGGTQGVYYDLAVNNQPSSGLVVIDPSAAHFLIKKGGAEITPQGIGRNSFQNPGTTTWNVAAQKDVPVARFSRLETASFQFRVEARNVFNHNDVGILDNNILNVGSPSYLNPVNARVNTSRAVRGWIKFAF